MKKFKKKNENKIVFFKIGIEYLKQNSEIVKRVDL